METRLQALAFVSLMMARTRVRGVAFERMKKDLVNPEGFFAAQDKTLRELLGGPPEAVETLGRFLKDGRDEALRAAGRLEKIGAGAVWQEDRDYPKRLYGIPGPPRVLFYLSEHTAPLSILDRPCVAVVGTREPTPYGEEAAFRLARDLARKDVVIVSGLAYGIDTKAHEGSLAGGGPTAAVMANGIDAVYPRENEGLAARIRANGILLSELPPGTPPRSNLFPARNRIISGLSDATAVVEAQARSGTMITAGCALDQGRDVFAVPGSIFSDRSDGTNQLLKEGAFVLTDCEDLLERLPSSLRLAGFEMARIGTGEGGEETGRASRIIAMLQSEALDADALARRLDLGIRQTSVVLGELELEGLIRKENGRYRANHPTF